MARIVGIIQYILIFLIRLYQVCIRPVMKPCCRFHPSCSEYAIMAIRSYGLCKGIFTAICRLLRCHPWANGGYDPLVVEKKDYCCETIASKNFVTAPLTKENF